MLVTMACKFPNPCWFAINVQAPTESLPVLIDSSLNPDTQDNTLAELNKYWDIFYAGWQSRPDKPGFLDKTLTAVSYTHLTLPTICSV